jgi:hypothetical protein
MSQPYVVHDPVLPPYYRCFTRGGRRYAQMMRWHPGEERARPDDCPVHLPSFDFSIFVDPDERMPLAVGAPKKTRRCRPR